MAVTDETSRPAQRAYFVLWALVGAGACLAALGVLTIGFFVAPVVAILALVLMRITRSDRSLAGAISGVSLMLFFVAWQNREGPGTVCTVHTHMTECAERWSPWPWFVVGLAFLSVGIAAFYLMGRHLQHV